MTPQAIVAGVSLALVLLVMLFEARLSRANERLLLAQGAVEPRDDVYRAMQVAYPGAFIAMAVEGAFWGPAPGITTAAGGLVLLAAKALKFWAITSLGPRWTFRVLVPPGGTLVSSGPYRRLRHPNYVGVIGELIGMALLVGAWITGPAGTLLFAALIARRIRVENAALQHPPNASA
jgi:methyltransferase